MKISYRWLKRYLNIDLSPERVAELLTDTGLEVEGIEEVERIKGGLRGVVVGEVLTCVPHPNADKLSITTVDLGDGTPLQIVCGAPNVAQGQKVPVATVGTVLYPDGEELKIKKGKIRGEVSMGMICAEDELGLGTSHDGILVLDAQLTPGTPASEVFEMESDHVFEIGLTPNRTDAMGHIGVARDLRAAILTLEGQAPRLDFPHSSFQPETNNPVSLHIQDADGCPAYNGIYFENVQVAPSPEWLQQSLTAIGIAPKNNVVDVTNYVLHTYGHPLHAFDAQRLNGQQVVVRRAHEGEQLVTLDGVERALHTDDLVIADAEKSVCLAGILGGQDSGVTEQTTSVYLEGAYFDPVRIRKTAKRHGLSTDASYRYERGVDPNTTRMAHEYAAALICELTGAKASPCDHQGRETFPAAQITFSLNKVLRLIGAEIEPSKVEGILSALDIALLSTGGDLWTVQVPTYRVDVTRDVDIAEEILRIYGFNNIPVPSQMRISVAAFDPKAEVLEKQLLAQLTGNGFYEIMNNSLTKGEHYEKLQPAQAEKLIRILNPLSQDLDSMRAHLLFGGLEAVSFNQKRQRPNLRLFERGRVYGKGGSGFFEQQHLDLFIAGEERTEHWHTAPLKNDFFELKGLLEGLFARLKTPVSTKRIEHELYSECLEFKAGKTKLALLGTVHPKVMQHFEVKGTVLHASLLWDTLTQLLLQRAPQLFTALPKYPQVRRDLALLVPAGVDFNALSELIRASDRKYLREVFLFDVYEGKNLPEGTKSYACGLVFQDEKKTLNDKSVDASIARILAQLKEQLGVELRS